MNQTDEIVFDLEREVSAIASALGLPASKVKAAAELLAEGNTIPFVARYRKERTGGLGRDGPALHRGCDRHLRELIERKNTVLKTIAEQGKLDAALREKILACREKKELEELYLPYKPKRRTRATIARAARAGRARRHTQAAGQPGRIRAEVLRPYIDPDQRGARRRGGPPAAPATSSPRSGPTTRQIRGVVREAMQQGMLVLPGPPRLGREARASSRCTTTIASRWPRCPRTVTWPCDAARPKECCAWGSRSTRKPILRRLTGRLVTNPSFLFRRELTETVADCYRRLLFPSVRIGAVGGDEGNGRRGGHPGLLAEPPRVAALVARPDQRVVLGIDPGFRTGCKVAVVDATGKFLEHATIYPTAPHNKTEEAARILLTLIDRHGVELIAIGTGTASRETDAFVASMLRVAAAGSWRRSP